MITHISAIPNQRLMSCDFVIITHYLPNTDYVFSDHDLFKKIGTRLKPISIYRSGRCYVAKINNKPKSITWLIANRKPKIDVYVSNYEIFPF